MDKIWLTAGDLQDINTVFKKFPDLERFCLLVDSSSGIGTTIDMEFEAVVNGIEGTFRVGIADESTW